MDGNLANLEKLENELEPGDIIHDAFPDLSINDIGHLEGAFMKISYVNNTIGIDGFIEFVGNKLLDK